MKIQTMGYPLPVSNELVQILTNEIENSGVNKSVPLCLNFKNSTYSSTHGGFHPVEIMISKIGEIQYITDFAYTGYPAELVKEIDFDFSLGLFQHVNTEYPINMGHALFALWQLNFCAYYKMDVYTVTVMEVQ